MKFLNLIIDGYRTTLSLLLILAIAGIYSYVNLPVESSPAVDVPYISIFIELDGVSPEDGVKLLLKPRSLSDYQNLIW